MSTRILACRAGLFGILLLLHACGLRYEPVTTPENEQENRQRIIESKMREDYDQGDEVYHSIAFGETEMIKPESYRALDSMYALKYKREISGQVPDRQLEEQIRLQRMVVLNDTNPIYYVENHVWEIKKNDTSTFYTGKFILDMHNEIEDVEISESVMLPASYKDLYTSYVYEESIFTPGFAANQQEQQFYNLYKSKAATLTEPKHSLFVQHTLDIMRIARQKNTLVTADLIRTLLVDKTSNHSYAVKNIKFTRLEELYSTSDQNEVIGYNAEFSYTIADENGQDKQYAYYAQLDPYLQIEFIQDVQEGGF